MPGFFTGDIKLFLPVTRSMSKIAVSKQVVDWATQKPPQKG